MSRPIALILLLGVAVFLTSGVALAADKGSYRVSTDYATPASMSCGIQEAIDSLPEGGGTVYLARRGQPSSRRVWATTQGRLYGE